MPIPVLAPDHAEPTGCALRLLSLVAAHQDPVTASELTRQSGMNPNTVSSRLSWLKRQELVDARGYPAGFMATPAGRAALAQQDLPINHKGE